MQLIKKETREVSIIETKPYLIKIPSLKIPVHYLKLTGVFILLLVLVVLTSYTEPVKVQEISQAPTECSMIQVTNVLESGQVEETKEEKVESVKAEEKKVNGKVIAITKIITNPKLLDFICHNQVLSRAYQVQLETGLSVATILAQKGLESNFNKSKFSNRTKNLSNIKCTRKECQKHNIKGLKKRGDVGSETSHCIQLWDDGPNDRYVKHDVYWKGWSQYAGLIKRVYSRAASKETVRGEAVALKARGFATDPGYANKIVNIATNNNLLVLQDYIDKGFTITTASGKYILLQP